MGEQVYTVAGRVGMQWADKTVQFSESDYGGCLCTFPHNGLDRGDVRLLAYLGAAVVLIHNGIIEDDANFLPNCLPEDIWLLIDGVCK